MTQQNVNFLIVILFQFAIFAVVSVATKQRIAMQPLICGLAAGIPLGIYFDLAIGRYGGIFNYFGREESHIFMLVNGIFSYGIAIATILVLNRFELPIGKARLRLSLVILVFSIIVVWAVPFLNLPSLASMFVIGAMILIASEAAALSIGRVGFVSSFLTSQTIDFWKIVVFSAAIGLAYEFINYVFPVWKWTNKFPSENINTLLIIMFGYFVLFLPIFTLSSLWNSRKYKLTE